MSKDVTSQSSATGSKEITYSGQTKDKTEHAARIKSLFANSSSGDYEVNESKKPTTTDLTHASDGEKKAIAERIRLANGIELRSRPREIESSLSPASTPTHELITTLK